MFLFKVVGNELLPVRYYYRLDGTLISSDFWVNVLQGLCSGDIQKLPNSDEITADAEKNLLGLAQHIAWKQLVMEGRSIRVDAQRLQRRAAEIHRKWMQQLIGY